jgi:hypothetical protein
MTHREVRAAFGDYLDGGLPVAHRALVDAHLDACTDCASHLRELRAALDALRSLGDPEPPPGLADAVLARIEAGEGRPSALARLLGGMPWDLRSRLATPALVLVSAALLLLWLRPAFGPPPPGAALPSLERALGSAKVLGASAAPDAASEEPSAGPIVPPQALDEALRDPASVLRATEALGVAEQEAWLAGLAQQAGSRERALALAHALRGLPDPRAAALADAFLRLAGVPSSR